MYERSDLSARLERAGVGRALAEKLARYGVALLESNRRGNLTGAKTNEELVPHLLDSLTVVPYIGNPHADVGSGGGMPAIPAAIATGVSLTLIESVAKKAVFLRSVLGELELEGTVVHERAEVAGHEPAFRAKFATASARAVATASTVAELLLPLLAIGGRAILQRGRIGSDERAALEDAALMLGGRVSREESLDGERRIIILEKIAPTPQRFPRRPGIPEKRPLCMRR